ncbi:AmmeMemoRadiSam system radical SAM enzyme [Pengzhenrongella phosphoraccumulans]|uniref:AmmeMemoRadiSam system radical SAM enzyme n=1 Tax=Pengzhenrongella phosphoraccumulans TaxID=3114394 RepID=UPI00388E3149
MRDDSTAPAPGAAPPEAATWPDAPTARWWSELDDGRLQCDLCPRRCRLHPGQRGFCFVRARDGDRMVLTTYGRSSGFAIDPVEKKPLAHFHPGTAVLSFGTAGCNLNCRFCQNWDISKSRERDRLTAVATPDGIAQAARAAGCDSVAFTYNDPVIFAEYAMDTALACHELGLHAIAVTAGYITAPARAEFFGAMEAANIDLKGFTEDFYWKVTGAHLRDVLETIAWVHEHTGTWIELTTLLIPGHNDATHEVERMCRWILAELGPDVPLHFSAFHPDFKMLDVPPTPPATLRIARATALEVGLHFVYTGNVRDPAAETTSCPVCGRVLVERDWYAVSRYDVTTDGRCPGCRTAVPGRFGDAVGHWGRRSIPVRIESSPER